MSKVSEVKIYHGAIVCKESKIKGDVTIGSMSIIHPCVSIIAEAGSIVIGDGNIIEEQTSIVNKREEGDIVEEDQTMKIGNNNVFEVGCTVESLNIGDNNIIEAKSYVARGVNIGKGCVIGAGCRLTIPEDIPDNSIIYGSNCSRRVSNDKPALQNSQREFLAKVLPGYHHLKKSKKASES